MQNYLIRIITDINLIVIFNQIGINVKLIIQFIYVTIQTDIILVNCWVWTLM